MENVINDDGWREPKSLAFLFSERVPHRWITRIWGCPFYYSHSLTNILPP